MTARRSSLSRRESNDLRAADGSHEIEVEVISGAAPVAADGVQHYINQGGCELAVATVSGDWTEAGVRVGALFVPQLPAARIETGSASRCSPFRGTLPADTVPIFYAQESAAPRPRRVLVQGVSQEIPRAQSRPSTTAFLERWSTRSIPAGSGDLLARFLKINSEMRSKNNQTLADLRLKTRRHFLWTEPFLPLANSTVESHFADNRSYT